MSERITDLYEVSLDELVGRETQDGPNNLLEYYRRKIITKFPDIDLMFKEMETLTADDLKDVYECIQFKQSQQY